VTFTKASAPLNWQFGCGPLHNATCEHHDNAPVTHGNTTQDGGKDCKCHLRQTPAPIPNPTPVPTVCNGNSMSLVPAECAAWIALFDETGGKHWTNCSSLRTDPFSCIYQGPSQKYGVWPSTDRAHIQTM
jgi:hypothetical protein